MPCPSSDHLTEILNELYEDQSYREWVGMQCQGRVLDEQFSWDTVASQFGGIFEDVMKQAKHSVPAEISEKPRKKGKKNRSLRKKQEPALT